MKSIAFVVTLLGIMLLAMMSVLLVVGLGAGWLVHWFLPSIEVGSAAVCGILATGFGIVFCATIVILLQKAVAEASSRDTDDSDDSDPLSEDQVDEIADRLTEAFLFRMAVPNSRSKPKTNRTR